MGWRLRNLAVVCLVLFQLLSMPAGATIGRNDSLSLKNHTFSIPTKYSFQSLKTPTETGTAEDKTNVLLYRKSQFTNISMAVGPGTVVNIEVLVSEKLDM